MSKLQVYMTVKFRKNGDVIVDKIYASREHAEVRADKLRVQGGNLSCVAVIKKSVQGVEALHFPDYDGFSPHKFLISHV